MIQLFLWIKIFAQILDFPYYHELTDLSTSLTQLENVHVATLEKDGQVTFLHKIEAGHIVRDQEKGGYGYYGTL